MDELSLAGVVAAAQQAGAENDPRHAVALYRTWATHHPDDPFLHVVYFNLGVLLMTLGDSLGAAQAFNEATSRMPDFLPAYVNLGVLYDRLGATEPALSHWNYVTQHLGAVNGEAQAIKATALKLTGQKLVERGELGLAEAKLREIIELGSPGRDVVQHWISVRQRECAWPLLTPVGALDRASLLRQAAPLSLATYADDPVLQLAGAHRQFRLDVGSLPDVTPPVRFRARPPTARLRIGYLSSDLREHAIGYLMAEMFGLHDRASFEIFVYYNGVAHEDATKRRIRDQAEHWTDVASLDDAAVLERMLADGVDILIDVNGHTRGARPGLLARRPAPVIVNWLGYPGTMGSPCHHYIVADPWIIPPGSEHWYTETVLRLPCYQPNDRQRPAIGHVPTRAECGLPEGAMVYCCFNGPHKLTRFVFDRWLEILRQVPASVLWLLRGGDETDANLRRIAAAAGIAPERLVFAPPLPHLAHVARYALADLFLDTAPYGAHTTASDALWMGVPVLTVPGRCFASRVCASLVHAAGVGDFVAASSADYVARAVRFGLDPASLQPWRERLTAGRGTCLLFDTKRLVRELEGLFRGIWADYLAGRTPQPDLTNLDSYLDVATGFDHDGEDFTELSDYEARYRTGLARLHAYAPLPADSRLWHPQS